MRPRTKPWGSRLLLLSLVAVLVLMLPREGHAATPAATPPTKVLVDIYVVNVGSIDQQKGSSPVDFYLSFAWNGSWYGPGGNSSSPALPQDFALMDGTVNQLQLISSQGDINGTGENYLSFRVGATLFDQMNFVRFPLDSQRLSIQIESNDFTNASLVYVPDTESQIGQNVSIPGWIVDGGSGLSVENQLYRTSFGYPGLPPAYAAYYSEAIFTINIHRPVQTAALTLVVPLVVLVALATISFRIRMDSFGPRLQLGVVSIFTAVAFLLNMNNSVPVQGYFTLGDDTLLVAFGVLIYSICVTVVLHYYDPSSPPGWAKALNRSSFVGVPLAAVLLTLLIVAL
ncbi:MAG: hypothetical protein JRN23_07215 [Nitrososphaerota archaeon]|nr:hypothetical protein [Nitrososphaerota archaeon]MDG6978346.1 hypothetical protein [Nitrososphaerota archaeon]MDG7021705.1 hypothetical protein [Nitrososphaerota archaeon]